MSKIIRHIDEVPIKDYPTDGLTAEYLFSDLVGTSIDDSSIAFNNNSGITGTGAVLDSGVIGSGIRLSNDTYFSIPANNVVSYDFSISMWVKFDDITSNQGLFTFGELNNTHAVIQASKGSSVLSLHSDYPTYQITTPLDSTWTTEFKHLVFVWDTSTLKYKLYVNNILTLDMTIANVDLNSKILKLGIYFGTTYGLNGIIDQFRLYNRALTQEEVSQLYNNGNGI